MNECHNCCNSRAETLPGMTFRVVELSSLLKSEVTLLTEGTEFWSRNTRVMSTTTDPLLQWKGKKINTYQTQTQCISKLVSDWYSTLPECINDWAKELRAIEPPTHYVYLKESIIGTCLQTPMNSKKWEILLSTFTHNASKVITADLLLAAFCVAHGYTVLTSYLSDHNCS